MTKKDFEAVAEILAQVWWAEEDLGKGVEANREAINTYLEKTNKNYNAKRFWQAVIDNKNDLHNLFIK